MVYNQRGIFWEGELSATEPIEARVAWVAQGQEQVNLPLPPAWRLREIDVTLDASGVPTMSIPDYALQPTERDHNANQYAWKFGNLVSDRSLILELPGSDTVTGRLVLLFRFVGLAVLLFGAGFWYVCEQKQPGRLAGFRWGHFLLLASTYCLFFVVFAALVMKGDLGLVSTIAISLAASLPLLMAHVARILNLRFAISRVLPLALLTLGFVIAGVYGGGMRVYLFLGFLIVITGYLTVTYRPVEREDVVDSDPDVAVA